MKADDFWSLKEASWEQYPSPVYVFVTVQRPEKLWSVAVLSGMEPSTDTTVPVSHQYQYQAPALWNTETVTFIYSLSCNPAVLPVTRPSLRGFYSLQTPGPRRCCISRTTTWTPAATIVSTILLPDSLSDPSIVTNNDLLPYSSFPVDRPMAPKPIRTTILSLTRVQFSV